MWAVEQSERRCIVRHPPPRLVACTRSSPTHPTSAAHPPSRPPLTCRSSALCGTGTCPPPSTKPRSCGACRPTRSGARRSTASRTARRARSRSSRRARRRWWQRWSRAEDCVPTVPPPLLLLDACCRPSRPLPLSALPPAARCPAPRLAACSLLLPTDQPVLLDSVTTYSPQLSGIKRAGRLC